MAAAVAPLVSPRASCLPPPAPKSHPSRLDTFGGFAYLAWSLSCSVFYLTLLGPFVTNDMWWPEFNATGLQTYVGDVVHRQLVLSQLGPVDVFGVEAAVYKNYSSPSTRIDVRPSYARRVLFDVAPLDQVIATMRSSTFSANLKMLSAYCWVDLNRTFEMALSKKRQARCNAQYSRNGFFYLDALLRNVAFDAIGTSSLAASFAFSILQPVASVAEGRRWLSNLTSTSWLPVDAEIRVWRSAGITKWRPAVSNLLSQGIDDTISIVNAVGLPVQVTINKAATFEVEITRHLERHVVLREFGVTLVRDLPGHFETTTGQRWDAFTDVPQTPLTFLVGRTLGPFGTIDIVLVPVPPSLIALAALLQRAIATVAQLAPEPFQRILEPTMDPLPRSWRRPGLVYYGGNPLCAQSVPLPYVHSIFSYSDNCKSPTPYGLALSRESILFAMIASGANASTFNASCDLCQAAARSTCQASAASTAAFHTSLLGCLNDTASVSTLRQTATADLADLWITLIQYGAGRGSASFLVEPMVSSRSWSLFGWVMLHDWVVGVREVYKFAGDEGKCTVITEVEPYVPLVAIADEIPRHACDYVWYTSVCVTVLVLFVDGMVLVAGAALKFRLVGRNLFQLHRVLASVWIGRSFLVFRSGAALVLLSSSPLAFEVNRAGYSHLRFAPRSALQVGLLAIEATWLAYAVTDILIPFTSSSARRFGPLANVAAFGYMWVREMVAPFRATATVARTCDVVHLSVQVRCRSGVIEYGSLDRLIELVLVNLASVAVSFAVAWMVSRHRRWSQEATTSVDVSLPAAAQVFLTLEQNRETVYMDAVSCIMAGFIPFRSYLLDVKLLLVTDNHRLSDGHNFRRATFASAPRMPRVKPTPRPTADPHVRLKSAIGLVYMVASVWGSSQFLAMTESRMTNDFWWARFNTSGMQTYLVNLVNRELMVHRTIADVKLDDPGDSFMDYSKDSSIVLSTPSYASSIQNEVNDLSNVVRGLRRMDVCVVPWIATAYCFVDYGRRWEMAPTAKMADRCQRRTHNGAVYLESVVRNAEWSQLHECWGQALDVAVFSYLRSSVDGLQWLASLRSDYLPLVPDEVQFWMAHGITTYETQWQNYKAVGVLDTLVIENAFGIQYPLTLKETPHEFTLHSETTMKMTWTLAMALGDVGNSSGATISGMSLVRASARFAFQNESVGQLTYERGRVRVPIGPGFAIFVETIGPFGSVALVRVPAPESLRAVYARASAMLATMFGTNASAQGALAKIPSYTRLSGMPKEWTNISMFRGGSLLCDSIAPMWSVSLFFLPVGTCTTSLAEDSQTHTMMTLVAVVMLSDATVGGRVAAMCDLDTTFASACRNFLEASIAVVVALFSADELDAIRRLASMAKADMQHLSIVQYVVAQNRDKLSAVAIFADPDFEFFAWVYAIQWVTGIRQVVSFQGDVGNLTVLSAMEFVSGQSARTMEVPVNVATYTRILLQYVTQVLGVIGALACVYIIASRGRVEMWNIFQFNRVAGLVWVGHPLLLLRGVAAIALLSTDALELQEYGFVTKISSTPTPWVTTLVSSGEVGWLVYFLNDVFSLATGEVTASYGWKHPTLVWAIAAIWGVASPVRYHARLDRRCTVEAVDFDVVCTSALIRIGRFDRFCGLVAISVVCGAICFALDRYQLRRRVTSKRAGMVLDLEVDRARMRSKFLAASAHYMFESDHWITNGVYYLDKASAVISGVVSIEADNTLYVVDVKKWRAFAMDLTPIRTNAPSADSFSRAIPLTE